MAVLVHEGEASVARECERERWVAFPDARRAWSASTYQPFEDARNLREDVPGTIIVGSSASVQLYEATYSTSPKTTSSSFGIDAGTSKICISPGFSP